MLSQVETLTKGQLDGQKALLDAATGSANPFAGTPAASGANNQGVIDAVDRLGDNILSGVSDQLSQLAAINQNLGLIIQQGSLGGGRSLIDTYRSVANF